MKFTCEKQKLMEAVANVQRAVSVKSSIPSLEGILLKAKTDSIFLCGYDLELGMTTEIPASVSESGSVVLSAKLFGDIVRRLPDDGVHVEVDSANVTKIQSGQSDFSIAGIPAEEYPELPALSDTTSVKIGSAVLKSMIRQTIFAVSDNDSKPIHTGTLFDLSEQKLRLISVDGYRLAIREELVRFDGELNFVVPGKTLQEIMKLLPEDDSEAELFVGSRHIMSRIGDYTVISRLLEGTFLDYRSAIPAQSNCEIRVKTRELIDSVERVSLVITDRLKSPLQCIFEDGEIRLSCVTSIGKASDQLAAELTGEAVTIGFNNRYLLEALRNVDSDQVRIQLNGPLSPMKMLPVEGNEFLFLVLPVRLK